MRLFLSFIASSLNSCSYLASSTSIFVLRRLLLAFNNWVQEKVKERNETLAKKQDLMIEMDPEIAQAF